MTWSGLHDGCPLHGNAVIHFEQSVGTKDEAKRAGCLCELLTSDPAARITALGTQLTEETLRADTAEAGMRVAPEAASTARATQAYTHVCGSCGCDIISFEALDDHQCKGCGCIVCDTCTLVHQHHKEGVHGNGDPAVHLEKMYEVMNQLLFDRDSARDIICKNLVFAMVRCINCGHRSYLQPMVHCDKCNAPAPAPWVPVPKVYPDLCQCEACHMDRRAMN